MATKLLKINRAPVLTLWAAVVAERLGFKRAEALTLGRAVAGLNAYAKGVSLGLFQPTPAAIRLEREKAARGKLKVNLMHRVVPVVRTIDGLRAVSGGRPIKPASVEHYLAGKFGDGFAPARNAMRILARSLSSKELSTRAYPLYVQLSVQRCQRACMAGAPPAGSTWRKSARLRGIGSPNDARHVLASLRHRDGKSRLPGHVPALA